MKTAIVLAVLPSALVVAAQRYTYATSTVTQCFSTTPANFGPPEPTQGSDGAYTIDVPECKDCGCTSCVFTKWVTVTYEVFVSTGVVRMPYTVKEVFHGMSTTVDSGSSTDIPYGFTSGVETCTTCGDEPVTATLTYPRGGQTFYTTITNWATVTNYATDASYATDAHYATDANIDVAILPGAGGDATGVGADAAAAADATGSAVFATGAAADATGVAADATGAAAHATGSGADATAAAAADPTGAPAADATGASGDATRAAADATANPTGGAPYLSTLAQMPSPVPTTNDYQNGNGNIRVLATASGTGVFYQSASATDQSVMTAAAPSVRILGSAMMVILLPLAMML
ncbi:hypothetical protein G7046_g3177 [Stylonectria norvegica]|nr:hypothetical protein G7046_g3177 [Stylonectria norvegica]